MDPQKNAFYYVYSINLAPFLHLVQKFMELVQRLFSKYLRETLISLSENLEQNKTTLKVSHRDII